MNEGAELFLHFILGLCALVALWPDYFLRFKNGEPYISDDVQPFTNEVGRACALVLFIILAIILLTYHIS